MNEMGDNESLFSFFLFFFVGITYHHKCPKVWQKARFGNKFSGARTNGQLNAQQQRLWPNLQQP